MDANTIGKTDKFYKSTLSTASNSDSDMRQYHSSASDLHNCAVVQASTLKKIIDDVEICAYQTRMDGQNALTVGNVSKDSKDNISLCNQEMTDLLSAMEDIVNSSKNISKIAKLIEGIATQTNILAINAAIEAARVGAQGKGFSVVAEEVRTLASKTQNAARETASLIENSLNQVSASIDIAKKTANSLDKITVGVNKIYTLMNEINNSTDVQAQAFARVNTELAKISNDIVID